MPFKLELSKSAQRLLNTSLRNGLVPSVRKEFSKAGPKRFRRNLLADMNKGVSPVKFKRWPKYSPSYKKQIEKGTGYLALASGSKSKGTVTLKVSGELWRSLAVTTTNTYFKSFRMIVHFKDFLADIHNRRGAGKSKVKRRMLPTLKGEAFNNSLTKGLVDDIKKAASTVVNSFK